jgi:hypothetical protein
LTVGDTRFDTNSQVVRVQNRLECMLFTRSQRLNGQNSDQQKRPNNLCASRSSVRSGSSALCFWDKKAPQMRGFFHGWMRVYHNTYHNCRDWMLGSIAGQLATYRCNSWSLNL